MILNRLTFLFILFNCFLFFTIVHAEEFPGSCIQWFYIQNNTINSSNFSSRAVTLNFNSTIPTLPVEPSSYVSTKTWINYYLFGAWFNKDTNRWTAGTVSNLISLATPTSLQEIGAIPATSSNWQYLYTIAPGCPAPTCTIKKGDSNYDLHSHPPSSAPLPKMTCYEGCQTTSETLWTDCIGDSCVSSVKYTYNGNSCSDDDETLNEEISPVPPDRCTSEIESKIAECGGSLNISSYDFETCTGVCVPDPCHDKWLALVNKCGGIIAVSNWNSETCSGVCAGDPIVNPDPVDPESPDIPRPPSNINTSTKINADGSKEVNQSITNSFTDGTTLTTNTTSYYNLSGEKTGQSTFTSSISGNSESEGSATTSLTPDQIQGAVKSGILDAAQEIEGNEGPEPSYPVPSTWYTKVCDLSNGLGSCVNYQQVFVAMNAFKQTALYQFPDLILQCLGYVKGVGCEYPPKISVDLFTRFTNGPIKIDLSPFESVVKVMKFFFSILCLVMTGKQTMILFQ